MRDYTHDEIVQAYAETLLDKSEINFEDPYNYYGSRGYVDLVQNLNFRINLYEVKKSIDSVNQVIRQYKKMKKYYIKDEDTKPIVEDHVSCYLVVLACKENFDIINDHLNQFNDVSLEIFEPKTGLTSMTAYNTTTFSVVSLLMRGYQITPGAAQKITLKDLIAIISANETNISNNIVTKNDLRNIRG